MHFDQDGTYNLVYIAEDECGNTTLAERVVEVFSLRTVLYPDGTFIINEKSTNQASNEALHGGTATNVYTPFNPNGATSKERYEFAQAGHRYWDRQKSNITSVKIGSVIRPKSTAYWFESCLNCTEIDLTNIDTSETTDMHRMFYFCTTLTSLNLANMNTSSVTDMNNMFCGCKALESINVISFDTSNVTNMDNMFGTCNALTSLDVSSFDTSKATSMLSMFRECKALTSLDVSNFNTSEVTDMEQMFDGCRALTVLDLTSFDTSKVTSMKAMFASCGALTTLDISSFDTSAVADVYQMFYYCSVLHTIYASANFDVTHITDYGKYANLFSNMSSNLVGGAGTVWASSHASDKTYARIDNLPDAPGYFTAKA